MTTPILGLEEWESSQAQPNVTVNTALRWLEVFSQLNVFDQDLNTPPGSPSDGDRYIVGSSPTGLWSGHAREVAVYMGTAWAFKEAPPGAICYLIDADSYVRWDAATSPDWIAFP